MAARRAAFAGSIPQLRARLGSHDGVVAQRKLGTTLNPTTGGPAAKPSGVVQRAGDGDDEAGPFNERFQSFFKPRLRDFYGSMPFFNQRDFQGNFFYALSPFSMPWDAFQRRGEVDPSLPNLRAVRRTNSALKAYMDPRPDRVVDDEQWGNANVNTAAMAGGFLAKMAAMRFMTQRYMNPRWRLPFMAANLAVQGLSWAALKDLQLQDGLRGQGLSVEYLNRASDLLENEQVRKAAGRKQ